MQEDIFKTMVLEKKCLKQGLKSVNHKRNIDKLNYLKLQTCVLQRHHFKNKKKIQATAGRTFAVHITHKRLVFRIYKNETNKQRCRQNLKNIKSKETKMSANIL